MDQNLVDKISTWLIYRLKKQNLGTLNNPTNLFNHLITSIEQREGIKDMNMEYPEEFDAIKKNVKAFLQQDKLKENKKSMFESRGQSIPTPKVILNYKDEDAVAIIKKVCTDLDKDYVLEKIQANSNQFYNLIIAQTLEEIPEHFELMKYTYVQKLHKYRIDLFTELSKALPIVNISLRSLDFVKTDGVLKFYLTVLLSDTNISNWVTGKRKAVDYGEKTKLLADRDKITESKKSNLKEGYITKLSELVVGKSYVWGGGAEYLNIIYVGQSIQVLRKNPEIKVGSSMGKGFIFKWEKQPGYIELGWGSIQKYVETDDELTESKKVVKESNDIDRPKEDHQIAKLLKCKVESVVAAHDNLVLNGVSKNRGTFKQLKAEKNESYPEDDLMLILYVMKGNIPVVFAQGRPAMVFYRSQDAEAIMQRFGKGGFHAGDDMMEGLNESTIKKILMELEKPSNIYQDGYGANGKLVTRQNVTEIVEYAVGKKFRRINDYNSVTWDSFKNQIWEILKNQGYDLDENNKGVKFSLINELKYEYSFGKTEALVEFRNLDAEFPPSDLADMESVEEFIDIFKQLASEWEVDMKLWDEIDSAANITSTLTQYWNEYRPNKNIKPSISRGGRSNARRHIPGRSNY